MTDSFADLWSSASPVNSTQQQPRKLSDHQPSPPVLPRRPQNDVFSLLAAPSSTTGTRSNSPSFSNGQIIQKNGTKPVKPSSPNGDAFSSLLSGSFANTTNNTNMTMAERAAKVEQEKKESLLKQQESVKAHSSTWNGLDSLGGTFAFTQKPSETLQQNPDDDWVFNAPVAAKASSSKPPPTLQPNNGEDDDWGLSDFASAPSLQTTKPAVASQSIWNTDESDQLPSPPRRQETRSPGDFDFGDREDRLLDDNSDDEDDVLGVLSKPADSIPPRHSPNRRVVSRSTSPPPHIIGQIVEMGFSPHQARIALAATSTGVDVQAALETLLANNVGDSQSTPAPERTQRRQAQHPQQRRLERDEGEDEEYRPRRRHLTDPDQEREREQGSTSTDKQKNLQEQADKLLAQASEIGLSMFTRANAFWSQGKEKVQRVYEERKATAGPSSNPMQNGRPKWMQDVPVKQDGDDWEDHGGFTDDREDDAPQTGQRERLPPADQRPHQFPSRPPPPPRTKISDLLAEETPAIYVSPYRRGPSRSQQQQQQRDQSSQSLSSTPQRIPSPIQMTHRNAVSASASAIATAMKHKTIGTEMFKLGRFSEAETAYSSAISVLPDSHLLLVQLYNNRALSRLKIGDHSGTISDGSYVISLIGAYHPAREAKVSKEEEGAGVDLADGLMKAYRRRAEAYEGKEKWNLAKKDWEVIAGTEWAVGKMRSDAVAGIGRCRKMATADSSLPAPLPRTIPKRQPPTTSQKGSIPSSEALTKLRAANNAADAEDREKHELKDSVDTKVSAWKTGKEDNIRALVASLETVLWPQLGWQKVGMHELVMPAQVKVKYTKAIAKLHPDKLNVNNTTLEQRMVANAVFGALNEAWNVFKP